MKARPFASGSSSNSSCTAPPAAKAERSSGERRERSSRQFTATTARGSVNPFASLKQDRTIEAAVSAQTLSLAKGLPLAGATCAYQVPDELLELARRKRGDPEITRAATAGGSDKAVREAGVSSRALVPTLPSLATPPTRDPSRYWLLVSVIAYLAIYASARLMLGL